jgi:CobQ-like glutamine amidotransferase family enzyme
LNIRLAHLYPRQMNIYGDRGNIICLRRRSALRDISLDVTELDIGDPFDAEAYDLVFIGGAQDQEQKRVADDLRVVKAKGLRTAAENNAVVLAVCGGYQLMGRYYREAGGTELPGLALLDIVTVHPGPDTRRFIGNVVAERDGETIVGFENHGGRTYLGKKADALARIVSGFGNNGKDGTEGAVYRNVFGTYLHGSLLPKNPRFADHLIGLALGRRFPGVQLRPLDDIVETSAHQEAVRLATKRKLIPFGG